MDKLGSSFSVVTYIFGCLILNAFTVALAVVLGAILNASSKEYWVFCTIANWLPVLFFLTFGAYEVHYTKSTSKKVLIMALFITSLLVVATITIFYGYGVWIGAELSWKNTLVPYMITDCIASVYFYLVDEHISGI